MPFSIWRELFRVAAVIGQLLVGVTAGLAPAAAYWAAGLAGHGHGTAWAVRGRVEDGLGGLAAPGGLCGAGVGLCGGPLAANRNQACADAWLARRGESDETSSPV